MSVKRTFVLCIYYWLRRQTCPSHVIYARTFIKHDCALTREVSTEKQKTASTVEVGSSKVDNIPPTAPRKEMLSRRSSDTVKSPKKEGNETVVGSVALDAPLGRFAVIFGSFRLGYKDSYGSVSYG